MGKGKLMTGAGKVTGKFKSGEVGTGGQGRKLPAAPKTGKVPTGGGGQGMVKTTKGKGPAKLATPKFKATGTSGKKTGGGAVSKAVIDMGRSGCNMTGTTGHGAAKRAMGHK